MFTVEDNAKIGKYLCGLILAKYKNTRQFCKAYLEKQFNHSYTDKQLGNLSNRMSQMIKGEKSIQLSDLPIFCELLEVSCEEIITAGKRYQPISGHVTNYEIAFSNDKDKWEEYINRSDNLILNSDEYNKTVIDYALEFKNYDFLKYLTDKKYIWFVDDSNHDIKDHIYGFCAGTSIKRREISSRDFLGIDLKYHCEERGLRQKMIALAMENKDYNMLTALKAREIPFLYQKCRYPQPPTDVYDYYDERVIEEIVLSENEVLKYFTEEFEITDQFGIRQKFIYPYIGEVLERLIEVKSKNVEYVIRRITEHNKAIYNKLSAMINEAFEERKSRFNYSSRIKAPVESVVNDTMVFYDFNEDDGFLSYYYSKTKKGILKFCSNVICVHIKIGNPILDLLIDKLNESYDSVRNIQPDTSSY